MIVLIKKHGVRIILLFIVFILILSNATGLFEINIMHGSHISINSPLFVQKAGYGLFVYKNLSSPEFIILLLTGTILSLTLPVSNPVPASVLTFFATIPTFYFHYAHPVKISLLPMEHSLLTILILYVINLLIGELIHK
jgi:hypothetical protein